MKKRSSIKELFADSKDNTPAVRGLARIVGIGLAALLIGALVITYGPIQTIAMWSVVFVCIVIAFFWKGIVRRVGVHGIPTRGRKG